MSDIGLAGPKPRPRRSTLRQKFLNLAASRAFQDWAARFPLTRAITRNEGEAMLDLMAGFVHTQALRALIEFRVLDILMDGPATLDDLATITQVPPDRLRVALNATVALGLLRLKDDTYDLTRRGAALTGVPGLADMIRHHDVLYRDLADAPAFFRGETETELARFWPYVFGAGAADDPDTAQRYSQLMTDSQTLVAEETLQAVSLKSTKHLMDVGGGTGAFLRHALKTTPGLQTTLFDLPAVVASADQSFRAANLSDCVTIRPGSFRDESLPTGADTISLVRVLYDHADETIAKLLKNAHDALPTGGRIIVSEPMTGGAAPTKAGDAYFAVYTLAMDTGRTRSISEIGQALAKAGFTKITSPKTNRPFITSVVTARKI